MRKIFFRLYLLMVLTMVSGILILFSIIFLMLRPIEKRDDLRIMKGTVSLAEKEFSGLSPERYPSLIRELNMGVGKIISFLPLQTLDSSEKELEGLHEGLLVSIYDEDTFYKRITGTDYVLKIRPALDGSDWFLGQDPRLSTLTVNLIKRSLGRVREEKWQQATDHISSGFGFPIALVNKDEVFLTAEQLEELKRHDAWFDDDKETAWHNFPGSDYLLRFGPISQGEPKSLRHDLYLVITPFFLLLAGSAFLWAKPMWRDLDVLSRAAAGFGRGDFDTHVRLNKNSTVHALGEAFNAMARRIKELISQQAELTHAVSHELRSPVARLRFALEMLDETDDESEREELSAEVRRNLDELDELVGEILVYSKLSHSKARESLQHVAAGLWLQECLDAFKHDEGSIGIETFMDPGKMEIRMDPRLMNRALSNLVHNALRYASQTIRVSLLMEKENVVLQVEDDGPGISPEDREKVFEPFIRLDESRDRKSGNHGLGLAIVRGIAEKHGGLVSIEKSPLGGACFRICWPGKHNLSTRRL